MIKKLKKILPVSMKLFLRTKLMAFVSKMFDNNTITFSQTGEDILLRKLFHFKTNGFYVDVGAFHPISMSNTHYFYSIKNWRGINIDACPGSMDSFKKLRSKDINLEEAISDEDTELTYFFIDKYNSMNSFSKDFLIQEDTYNKVTKEILIKTKRLDSILKEYLIPNTNIDFMSIDVEGKDLNVLKSNNWELYRPEIIVIETENTNINEIKTSPIAKYLLSVDYEIISIIYQEENSKNLFFRDIRH